MNSFQWIDFLIWTVNPGARGKGYSPVSYVNLPGSSNKHINRIQSARRSPHHIPILQTIRGKIIYSLVCSGKVPGSPDFSSKSLSGFPFNTKKQTKTIWEASGLPLLDWPSYWLPTPESLSRLPGRAHPLNLCFYPLGMECGSASWRKFANGRGTWHGYTACRVFCTFHGQKQKQREK